MEQSQSVTEMQQNSILKTTVIASGFQYKDLTLNFLKKMRIIADTAAACSHKVHVSVSL